LCLLLLQQRNPYDVGFGANFKSVFGNNWKLWLYPSMESVEGDGITFPTCIHGNNSHTGAAEDENEFVVEIEEHNQAQNVTGDDHQHSEEENSMEYLAVIKQR